MAYSKFSPSMSFGETYISFYHPLSSSFPTDNSLEKAHDPTMIALRKPPTIGFQHCTPKNWTFGVDDKLVGHDDDHNHSPNKVANLKPNLQTTL